MLFLTARPSGNDSCLLDEYRFLSSWINPVAIPAISG
jgi:hypothetical protein